MIFCGKVSPRVRVVLVRVPTNQIKSIKNPVQINEQDSNLFDGFVSPRRFRHEGTKALRNTKWECYKFNVSCFMLLEP